MKSPIFRPAAAADVEDAYRWYEAQQAGLGEEFLAAVRIVIVSMTTNPERFPVVHRQTRRALLRRFPYGLYYRIVDDQIVVVACMHGRRGAPAASFKAKSATDQLLESPVITNCSNYGNSVRCSSY